MRSYLLAISVCAFLSACMPPQAPTPQPNMPAPQPMPRTDLNEISLDTNLSAAGLSMDWMQIFGTTTFKNANSDNNLGFGPRVASFGSASALSADTLEKLQLIDEVAPAQKTAAAELIAQRVSSQIDFSKQDFVAVYMNDGGPPFGDYGYGMVGDTLEFCIAKKPNPSGISGMALQTIVKFYAAPKGLKVKQCGHKL